MKTAREIIAGAIGHPHSWGADFDQVTADAILAALAAEGFSIVETVRDPACDWNKATYGNSTVPSRSLSRSTRKGKTE